MNSEPLDNRAIVARDGSSGLQQQGSVDWGRVTGSVVNFAVDFLVRLSNAGIETLTIIAAETVLANMKLGPNGEKHAIDAVTRLKSFSTLHKALYFGFGADQAIRQLVQSAQGLNCVTVCAALIEFYSVVDSAKTLRALLVSTDAPPRLTPSLKQWIALVEACS